MQIMIYGLNYAPELVGVGKYTGEMAQWLQSRGHQIRVVSAPPYYPDWHIQKGYSSYKYRSHTLDGIKVYRCPLWLPNSLSGKKRILHLLSFAISSAPVVLWQIWRWRPKAIVIVTPTLFCTPIVLLCSFLFKSKSWLHIQDFEIDMAFELGMLKGKSLRQWVLQCEKKLLGNFDIVSTISKRMQQNLLPKGVAVNKALLFPNWVDTKNIYPLKNTSFCQQHQMDSSKCIVLYSGSMGQKQGLEILIEAAQKLRDKNIHFVICGNGGILPKLQQMAQGLTNIAFLPLQSLEKFNELLNMAQIHLVLERPGAADFVMPSKLTGILACAGAVIATANANTQIAQVINEVGGILCPPADIEALCKAIIYLQENEQIRQSMGHKARAYAQKYLAKETVLSNFEQQLESL